MKIFAFLLCFFIMLPGELLALPPTGVGFISISADTAAIEWVLDNPAEEATTMLISTNPVFAGAPDLPGGVGQVSATFSGLISNVTYYFKIKVSTEAVYSEIVSSATNAAIPVSPSQDTVGTDNIQISWGPNNNFPDTQYQAEAALDEGFITKQQATGSLPYADFTGLLQDSTYFLQVKALGVAGRDSDFLNVGTTVTLALPPAFGDYLLVSSTNLSVVWQDNGNPPYTIYQLEISSSDTYLPLGASNTGPGIYYEASGLIPDTTYYSRARAVNGAGMLTAYEVLGSTITHAALPAGPVTLTPAENSIDAAWDANTNPADTQYFVQVSTSDDFSGTDYGPGTWAQSPVRDVTGLTSEITYYLRAKARNRAGLETGYFVLGQGEALSGPDITPPTVLPLQPGDNTWRGGASGLYRVHFTDFASKLDRFQARVATGSGFTGTVIADWTDIVTNINAETYTTDWELPADTIFTHIPENVASYVSVRVYDNAGNVNVSTDVFYVLRDTTTPTITDNQTSPDGWQSTDPGPVFSVDFADALSGLARVYYSASSIAGSANGNRVAWTEIASFVSSASYTAPWGVNFALLADGASNYVSVKALDVAGNQYTLPDVFRILKNTVGPAVAILSPAAPLVSTVTAFSGTATAMNEVSPVASVDISLRDLTSPTSEYYNGTDFSSSGQVWLAATGQALWSFNASTVPFILGRQYQVQAMARDINALPTAQLSIPEVNFELSQTVPTVALSTPEADSTVAFFDAVEGTAAPGSAALHSVQVYVKRLFDGQWWNFVTGAWDPVQVGSATVAGATWSFTPGTALRGSLAHGQLYFVTAQALDVADPQNVSAYAVPGATFTCVDTVPPETVTQIAASTGTAPGRIDLAWTFAGDDGGTLPIASGQYAVQYATYTDAVFSTQAAQVLFATGTVVPGAAQQYTVSGLAHNGTYYLELWVADDAGLWSSASPQVTTMSGESLNNQISGTVKAACVTGDTCVGGFTGVTGVMMEAYTNTGMLAATANTLDDGLGTFTLGPLDDGLYRVQATKVENGFSSSIAKDQIPMGYADVNFLLSLDYLLAAISGTIPAAAPSGLRPAAAGGGEVQLWQGGRKVSAVYANAAGRFNIRNLIPGRYTLKVADAGGAWRSFEVLLASGQTLQISPLGTLLEKGSVYAYPNPAVTKVTFHARMEVSPVTVYLSVFSLDGTLVKSAEEAVPGPAPVDYLYTWNFSGGKPASGVYFYTMRVKQDHSGKVETTTRKLAVVR